MKSYDGVKFYILDDGDHIHYLLTQISDEYYQVTWGKNFVITLSEDDIQRHFNRGYWIEVNNPRKMLKERLKHVL